RRAATLLLDRAGSVLRLPLRAARPSSSDARGARTALRRKRARRLTPLPPAENNVRPIVSHKVNPANDKLEIAVLDEPGAGGAPHLYQITGFDTATNPSDPFTTRYGKSAQHSTILFQN